MSDQKMNARNERYFGYLMGVGIGLMILALLLRGLGTIDDHTTTRSIFAVGLALFLLGLLTWLYLFRPWARFDDLKTPYYTGDRAHGDDRQSAADRAEAYGDEAMLVAAADAAIADAAAIAGTPGAVLGTPDAVPPLDKAGLPVAVPTPQTAIEPHVIQVPAPKEESVADVAASVGEAARDVAQAAAHSAAETAAVLANTQSDAGSVVNALGTEGPDDSDNLTLLEGIGPKVNAALQAAGVKTFAALSRMAPAEIIALLQAAKVRIVSSPETWPEQAALAARGDLEGLRAFQVQLKAGQRKRE